MDLDAIDLETKSDSEIANEFYPKPPGRHSPISKIEPDFCALLQELERGRRRGLTRYLLWTEYRSEAGIDVSYGYSSFCRKLSLFDESRELVWFSIMPRARWQWSTVPV